MRQLLTFALLGLGLSFAQPAFSCDMHSKNAKGGCGCKHCDEKSCAHEQAKGEKACGCKMGGAEKVTPSKEKPTS